METEYHIDIIECPECKTIQQAIVEHKWPWYSRVHWCINCEFIIMESDWKIVEPKKL
jgi:hypothetical protein